MRTMRSARAIAGSILAAGALAAAWSACAQPTSVVLEITTDVPCGEMPSTAIVVGTLGQLEGKPPTTTTQTCADGKVGSLVILPSRGDDDEVAVKIATGVGRPAESCVASAPTGDPSCIVARRSLRYVPGRALRLPVQMAQVCKGQPCSPLETCVKGNCVSASIRDSSPCVDPGACAEDLLARQQTSNLDGGVVVGITDSGSDASTPDGASTKDAAVADSAVPDASFTADAGPIEALFMGSTSVCVGLRGGARYCWGKNDAYQLDVTPSTLALRTPTLVPSLRSFPFVRTTEFGVGLDDAGNVQTWGDNGSSSLGRATAGSAPFAPGTVPSLPPSSVVTSGAQWGCAIARSDGVVRCWGDNSVRQLGRATPPNTPDVVPGLPSPVRALWVGEGRYSCAITGDGDLYCWGENDRGQTGAGAPSPSVATATRVLVDGGAPFKADTIATGTSHACALRGQLVSCWGRSDGLQLGFDAGGQDILTPTAAPAFGDVLEVVVGWWHTCVLRTDRTVACAGFNDRGQVGSGRIGDYVAVAPVPGLTNVLRLAAGSRHSCALLTNGALLCWGSDERGELANTGDGGNTVRAITVP